MVSLEQGERSGPRVTSPGSWPCGETAKARRRQPIASRVSDGYSVTIPTLFSLPRGDGDVIGSLIVAWDGWRGSFYRLAVDTAWRRRGIATALVRAGEERLRELGAIRLTALVASADREAIGLWRSVGYECQPGTSRYVRMLG